MGYCCPCLLYGVFLGATGAVAGVAVLASALAWGRRLRALLAGRR